LKIKILTYFLIAALLQVVFAKVIPLFFEKEFFQVQAVFFLFSLFSIFALSISNFELAKITTRWNGFFLAAQTLFWLSYLLIIYPGFYTYDSFTTLVTTTREVRSFWQASVYSFIAYSLSLINSQLFMIPVLNILLWLSCLAVILFMYPICSQRKFSLVLLVSFLPLNIIMLPLLLRDTLFGMLSCLLIVLFIPFLIDSKRKISTNYFLAMLFILLIASEIRQDGLIYYFSLPLLFWVSENPSLKKKIPLTLVLCGFMVVLNLFTTAKEPDRTTQRHEINTMLHPLNAIFYSSKASISDHDKEVVSKVIDTIHLETRYNPLQIVQFHDGLDKIPIPSDDWTQFKLTYLKLVSKNFLIFLKERILMAGSCFGVFPSAYIFADDLETPHPNFQKMLSTNDYPKALSAFRDLRKLIVQLLNDVVTYRPIVSVTLLNPLFFLLIAFFVTRKNRETVLLFRVSATLLMVRSALMFFIIPEPHLWYFSPLIYLPALLIIASILSPARQKQDL
jgi:hypothetical protein